MNDPADAAVIFVEQPEGLCGLTNRSTFDARDSPRPLSTGRNNSMKSLFSFPSAKKATPITGELGHVMIRCAESGEGVPAGMSLDPASLDTSNLTKQTFRCPHCGQEHTWSAKDAWVE